MASVPFSIVDVFSTTAYKGNPLAVVNDTKKTLTTNQMKLITRQFNLSETTFILPPTTPKAAYALRSFLPDGKEVFGAGHNILGAWWSATQSGLLDLTAPSSVNAEKGVEEFVVHQELGGVLMPVKLLVSKTDAGSEIDVSIRQISPKAHGIHPNPAALAQSLGLKADDIGIGSSPSGGQPLYPQVMSTSTTRHLIVPIASVDALNRASVERGKLLEQLALVDEKAYGIYLFTPSERSAGAADGSYAAEARFFSPGMSGEDPATGSAAGPLSAYLHWHGHLNTAQGVGELVVRQGVQVGRECIIRVALSAKSPGGGEVQVDIVGGGVKVAEGLLSVPDATTLF